MHAAAPQLHAPPDPLPAHPAGKDAVLLATGGDDQAIHVAVLGLEWPRGGGALRLSVRATLRLPNAHGSAVRVCWRRGAPVHLTAVKPLSDPCSATGSCGY